MINIKECVKKEVTFVRYREGDMWYKTCNGDEFPVTLSDVDKATLGATEKGLLLMRYMRKWNKVLEAESSSG